jgi:hypothetical protein
MVEAPVVCGSGCGSGIGQPGVAAYLTRCSQKVGVAVGLRAWVYVQA